MLISTFLLTSSAFAGIPFAWDVHEGARHRWLMETEIALPGHVWLYADRNIDVRARTLRVQVVLNCEAQAVAGLLECRVLDASLAGTTYSSERGLLQPVLEEIDSKLTDARVRFRFRPDGRVRGLSVKLNSVHASSNRRTRHTSEIMRVVMQRLLSPFDLQIPYRGLEEGGWPQYESTALRLLTLNGTAGGGRLVHRAQRWGEGLVLVSTAGKATLLDGATADTRPTMFSTQITGHTLLDVTRGTVSEARWEIVGEPTASAGIGAAYHASRVQIRALGQDETVLLQPTEEWLSLDTPLQPAMIEAPTQGVDEEPS